MKHARIQNGFVVETLEADSLPEFHPSLVWVSDVPEVVSHGYAWDGVSFTSPDDQKTVQQVKDDRKIEVTNIRVAKINEGFTYNGKIFQVDIEAQKDMTAIQVQFLGGQTNPHGGAWRTSDNEAVAMNDAEVQAFFQAAFAYVLGVKTASWAHKENIDNLNAKSDILEYDVNLGWP